MQIENIAFFLRDFLKKPKTGRLIIDKDRIRREYYFKDSRLIYSISNAPEEKFGVFVKKYGIHLQENVEKMLKNQYKSKIGKRLVELGFIDEKLLKEILVYQTKEIFISSINIFNIDYKWEKGKETPNQSFFADLNLLPILLEGLRRINNYDELKYLVRGEPEVPVSFDSNLLKLLSEKEYGIFVKLRSGEKINPEEFGLVPNKFNKILFIFLCLGLIKVKKVRDELAELKEFYDRLGIMDYWELLGIPENANTEMIKDSYFSLSKKFHPDKFSSYGEREKEMASKVFTEITKAYEILTNPSKKREYKKEPRKTLERGPKRKEKISPEDRFKEGRAMYARKRYREAAYLFDLAVRAEPENYNYVYWLGVVLSKLPEKEKEAERVLLKAAELSPWDPQPYVVLATMLAKRGLRTKALSMVEKALITDPEHPIALKLKEKLGGKVKKKGFLSFFKK